MRVEKAIFRPGIEHATPRGVADFFEEVFAVLSGRPRRVMVEIDFSEAGDCEPIVLDMEKGEPVFAQQGSSSAHGKLGGRWLAEHAVPCTLGPETARFDLVPTDAERIKVRPVRPGLSFWYNMTRVIRER